MNTQLEKVVDVSVVVPCRDQAQELQRCLRCLAAQEGPVRYEIIVVDSAADEEIAAVANNFSLVRLVRSHEPLMAGLARNLGARTAVGRVIAFVDADCAPSPSFVIAVHRALAEGIRAVTGPIEDADPRLIPVCDNLLQFSDFSINRPDGPAPYAPGGNLAIRREDFLDTPGFPDGEAEDLRFCFSLLQRWPNSLHYRASMVTGHIGRAGIRTYLRHHFRFGRSRARHGILVKDWHLAVGRHAITVPPIVLKRFSYLVTSVGRLNPRRLPFVLAASPLLLLGILAWAVGFRRGCLERRNTRTRQQAPKTL